MENIFGDIKKLIAIEQLKLVIQYNPSSNAYNKLGNELYELTRYEEAIEQFILAIQCNPHCATAHNNLGLSLRELQRNEEAMEQYKIAIQCNPSFSIAYFNLGSALLELKRYEEAIEQFTLALKYDPSYSPAYSNLGNVFYELKRFEDAIEQYKLAIHSNPHDPCAYYYIGNALYTLNRYEEAIEQFKLAIQYNPSFSTAYYNMGIAFLALKRYEESIEQFKLAIHNDPSNARAYFDIGRSLMILGKYDEAMGEYKHSIELLQSPSNDDKLFELNYVNVGWIMIKKRDFQSVNQIFTIELKNELSTDDGKLIKTILLYKQGDYQSSVSLIHTINANKLQEINYYYYYMAMCLWKSMNGEENEEERRIRIIMSIEWLNKAIKNDKEWVKPYYRRAQLLSLVQSSSDVISSSKADIQFVIQSNHQNPSFYQLSLSKISFLKSSLKKGDEEINGEKIQGLLGDTIKEDSSLEEIDNVEEEKKELRYYTAVSRAALLGDTEKLISIIKEDWSLLEEIENDEKNTPLLLAAREGHINTVSSLLLHGANISAINQSGDDIMKLSLPHNNLYLFLQEKKEIYQRDGDGNTTLHIECFRSNTDQVIDLLSKGASVHVFNNDENSPLHLSLLSPFALEKINDPKIQEERLEKIRSIIEKLTERGADLNITNKKFQTSLSLIVNLGFEKLGIEIGRLLLSNRGKASRGWIRYHLRSALSLYHGDFHHSSKDQDLLDLHVSFLTGFSLLSIIITKFFGIKNNNSSFYV